MTYTNSPLVVYTKFSPNHSGLRTRPIDRITPHCVVGQLSVEELGDIFAPEERAASSHYGIGPDGRVAMYVKEKNRSWCSSSEANDQRAVTIECASDLRHPYAMNGVVFATLVDLCVDICRRNEKTKLLWLRNKRRTLAYDPAPNEMVLTVHRWFAKTRCPGDWLYYRLGALARQVTDRLIDSSLSKEDTAKGVKPFFFGFGGLLKKSSPAPKNPNAYRVKVMMYVLNVHKAPTADSEITATIEDFGVYTVIAESAGKGASRWGKLENGLGWIALENTLKL